LDFCLGIDLYLLHYKYKEVWMIENPKHYCNLLLSLSSSTVLGVDAILVVAWQLYLGAGERGNGGANANQ
jgi:hypothetical protein